VPAVTTETKKRAIVLGGTQGIGKEVVKFLAARGEAVILTGRTPESTAAAVAEINATGLNVTGIALDLSEPKTIAAALKDIPSIDHIVISAIERDANQLKSYDIDRALRLVTLKLVGYTEVVHQLSNRITPEGSVVLFGGLAMERPYPGSTTVSTVNGGVTGLVRSMAIELAPTRVNALHPGIIGDSPYWADKDNSRVVERTPLGRLVTMQEIVGATAFLLDNHGINGINLAVDGGWLIK
jgi:NAD(P)-dependent dehydrogenase (short-subunit alcohol dehydrogenase family)